MQPRNYIAESQARVAPRFTETRRLLAIWQSEFRIYLLLPNAHNAEAARLAFVAYRAEQERAFSSSTTTNPI